MQFAPSGNPEDNPGLDASTSKDVVEEPEGGEKLNNKRQRRSFRDKTFISNDPLRRKEFDKQVQILKDRAAALALSTGSEVVLGVVTREGEPLLWSTPGLHDFMVRDCDFNDVAPGAVAVAQMVQSKKSYLSAQISDLPLQDKQKALSVVFERIFDKRKQLFPYDNTTTEQLRVAYPWFPASVQYKDPMSYTEADRDPQTGELHCDRVLKAVITSTDLQKLQYDLQYNVELSPESLAKFLGSIKKFLGFFTSAKAVAGGELSRGLMPASQASPVELATCEMTWQGGVPKLGHRATVAHVRECLHNESSIKYNKGGTVKVAGHSVNLHELYNKVREAGGNKLVTDQKAWKAIAKALDFNPCNADTCRSLRNTYQRYLAPLSGVSPMREMPEERAMEERALVSKPAKSSTGISGGGDGTPMVIETTVPDPLMDVATSGLT